ncbi:hypothetical protein QBC46DRAFT_438402 [Diplogelasinospora grovesii]|uniref:Fungal N-terminal domain-containing protein n=1 Tax=Diplogelasinospora grovesii TaxID=303347 RepID=A0AAN6S468_9PEZI|nr:hypothetical protein QBC46DRAFT_438402 [Diplogelasinospora grovesii]
MDPASATRPIEYVLSGVSTTLSSITQFIRSVRTAHADLAAVTRELSDLRLLLELLLEEPDIPLLLQAQVLSLLQHCGDLLIRVDVILTNSRDAARWAATGRDDMIRLKDSLQTHRQSLSLVLEVVNLSTSRSNAADTEPVRDHIVAEIDRLRSEVRLVRNGYDDLIDDSPFLETFFNAVLECIPPPRGGGSSAGHVSAAKAPDYSRTSYSNLEPIENHPLPPSTEKQLAPPPFQPVGHHAESATSYRGDQQFEAAGPWYPSSPIVLPFYNPPLEPTSPTQQALQRIVRWQSTTSSRSAQSDLQMQRLAHYSPQPIQQGWQRNVYSPGARSEELGARTPQSFSPVSAWSEPTNPSSAYPGPSYYSSHSTSIPSTPGPGSPGSSVSMPRMSPSVNSARTFILPPRSPGVQSSATLTPGFESQWPRSPAPSQFSELPAQLPDTYRQQPTNFPSQLPQSPGKLPQSPKEQWKPAIEYQTATSVSITPTRHLLDKGKAHDVLHIDISPTSCFAATKHSNNTVKVWSLARNALSNTIKITSYAKPQARSREYFVRSHAIISESDSLLAVTTHFGLTLEIYNWVRGKKVQVIEEVHRWASSRLDAWRAPLAVYRPRGDRIDLYFPARQGAKKPYWEDSGSAIELREAGLPFVPKFPELAYLHNPNSSAGNNGPILIAAAGPRPNDAPSAQNTILVAWLMQQNEKEEQRHAPYRFLVVPEHLKTGGALPACLAAHGNVVVSSWIPPNHIDIPLPGGKFRRTAVPAPERYVLVWDLPSNALTSVFAIPNVQAAVSPDCRFVAYCDPGHGVHHSGSGSIRGSVDSGGGSGAVSGCFVILDVQGNEVWRWPHPARTTEGFASFGGQFERNNLAKVTAFGFSDDARFLIVGDASGSVGVYEVRELGG